MSLNDLPEIRVADYHYELPSERIAALPVEPRDSSRMLLCDRRTGEIKHHRFAELSLLLPEGSLLLMNDARVVRARLHLVKETGGHVEVLLLDPVVPSHDPAITLAAVGECTWHCMVGGLKKMRGGAIVSQRFEIHEKGVEGRLLAILDGENPSGTFLRFHWEPSTLSFSEVLEATGHVPLPTYIKREDEPGDAKSYQTVYSRNEGAVAAPTAGLHFTDDLLSRLSQRKVKTLRLTLHVGAGTFAPVKSSTAQDHHMHEERISIKSATLDSLIEYAGERERRNLPFIHVGTTTLRTLESLYWFGVKLSQGESEREEQELRVRQWDAWRLRGKGGSLPPLSEALHHVDEWRRGYGLSQLFGYTQLMIVPGYDFQTCDALLTNFHQPESTLILLVAAFLGNDLWRKVYSEALDKGYRFLSYGDSSLLVRSRFPQ
ncbi:MAG: S-adenosylmethionine:tRNA ribosyltransferase-isomerase [Chlorobi bacterium]|nr:S-adenosylmethionine:tRNA ribosyltransferase-isomerase [Chlorobiota bacterium]